MRPLWWEKFLIQLSKRFFVGLLSGITADDWFRLLRENSFAIDPTYWPRAALVTLLSITNSVNRWREERTYGAAVADVQIKPPLFILGHWRTGTTHLHNLLAVDQRFAFPNTYQTIYPHMFLCSEASTARWIAPWIPERRLQDNVRLDLETPQEDEFALLTLTLASPYLDWAFPRSGERYERYLTFAGVPEAQIAHWKAAFIGFLKKLTWKYGRPLLLKSPPHTCRIKLLLDLFPDARFVHIHRNPYVVFQSTKHLLLEAGAAFALQHRNRQGLDAGIIRRYYLMYDAFFEQRALISADRFCEVSFEDLEIDPVGQMRAIYEKLALPDFAPVEPALRQYVATLKDYRKNKHSNLPTDLRQQIAEAWRECFEEWNYQV